MSNMIRCASMGAKQIEKSALVLPGGGARGAFQVGVLKAVAEMVPKGTVNPFPIISGTSAGAVNATVLAAKARRFKLAIAELERVWGNFRCHHVYRTDNLTMLKASLQWLSDNRRSCDHAEGAAGQFAASRAPQP